ncbi:MAG: hypothetical protein LBK66_07115 [Spirochaetaceae bacterium]|jgi:hypothetical protein|nr:hypothetical protein [Spirochaetaceae bacterium]
MGLDMKDKKKLCGIVTGTVIFLYFYLRGEKRIFLPLYTKTIIQPDKNRNLVLRTRQVFIGFKYLKMTALKTHDVIAARRPFVFTTKNICQINVPQRDMRVCSIGGYQPAQKWLKDRKGRSLTYDEIEHYRKILTALHLTIEIQARIDEVKGV